MVVHHSQPFHIIHTYPAVVSSTMLNSTLYVHKIINATIAASSPSLPIAVPTTTPNTTIYLDKIANTTITTATLNITSELTSPTPAIISQCCFIVQDSLVGVRFEGYLTYTTQIVIRLTAFTTYVTPYPNSTLVSVLSFLDVAVLFFLVFFF